MGDMTGLERTVAPLLATEEFHVSSVTLITSFLVSFGIAKAVANFFSGQLADQSGRKPVLLNGMACGFARPAPHHVRPELGLDRRRQHSPPHQSGVRLVDDGGDEDRSPGEVEPRFRDGPQ